MVTQPHTCTLRHPNIFRRLRPMSQERSVLYKGKTWDVGQELKVGFIGGTPEEVDFVKKVYGELDFINLKFVFTQNLQETDVRWSFVKGGGSWSYLGTDALFIPKNQATVNIGWTVDYKVVRHELGHSLGLAHEHQHPEGGIPWNKPNVINDLTGPPNYWSLSEIQYNVFNVLSRELVDFSIFDRSSIMLYPTPDHWVLTGVGTPLNTDWSGGDKAMLKKHYPLPEVVQVDNTALFIKELFPTEMRLTRLTEWQLVIIGSKLGLDVKVEDLKKDTITTIYNKLFSL